ncbi:hypothetical protein [Leptospira stimsonii]|uniref:Uncharacterized protein n=1 Tax=Leptospira stimsonii TaxID=2202203 RepID=A0ABY2NF60_9LEPT|nr:hypothetical protein [Leptospira stimsonii]TGK15320.1 hypothetical protein EHO98_15450 [Leptospira stimsonii]TGM22846.1 hypothetical protein EHQ90_00115 [Leptospira stimsonii]
MDLTFGANSWVVSNLQTKNFVVRILRRYTEQNEIFSRFELPVSDSTKKDRADFKNQNSGNSSSYDRRTRSTKLEWFPSCKNSYELSFLFRDSLIGRENVLEWV